MTTQQRQRQAYVGVVYRQGYDLPIRFLIHARNRWPKAKRWFFLEAAGYLADYAMTIKSSHAHVERYIGARSMTFYDDYEHLEIITLDEALALDAAIKLADDLS